MGHGYIKGVSTITACDFQGPPCTVVGETFAVGVKNELDEGDGSFFFILTSELITD